MDLMDQNFATKADFKEHYFMTRNDLLELRTDFKDRCDKIDFQLNKWCDQIDARFDQLENKLIIKLGAMQLGFIAVVSAIISFHK